MRSTGPAGGPDQEQYYRVAEVAALVQVSPGTIWKLVWSGEMRSIRIGRARRVPSGAVGEFLAAAEAPARGR